MAVGLIPVARGIKMRADIANNLEHLGASDQGGGVDLQPEICRSVSSRFPKAHSKVSMMRCWTLTT